MCCSYEHGVSPSWMIQWTVMGDDPFMVSMMFLERESVVKGNCSKDMCWTAMTSSYLRSLHRWGLRNGEVRESDGLPMQLESLRYGSL